MFQTAISTALSVAELTPERALIFLAVALALGVFLMLRTGWNKLLGLVPPQPDFRPKRRKPTKRRKASKAKSQS